MCHAISQVAVQFFGISLKKLSFIKNLCSNFVDYAEPLSRLLKMFDIANTICTKWPEACGYVHDLTEAIVTFKNMFEGIQEKFFNLC